MANMENLMQDRFDALDARMAAAIADARSYANSLSRGDYDCCLAIETAWGLDGYPPEIVSRVLEEVAGGSSDEEALSKAVTP